MERTCRYEDRYYMRRVVARHPARLLVVLIGPALLIAIIWRTDLTALGHIIGGARPGTMLTAFALVFVFHVLKAARWKLILRGQAIVFSLLDCYLMYSAGLLLGLFTPGRVGDFAKIWYIRNLGHGYGRSSVSVFLDRFFDLLVLAFISVAALIWFTQTSLTDNSSLFYVVLAPPIIGLLALVVLLAYWSPEKQEQSKVATFVQRWVPSAVLTQIIEFRRDMKAIPPAAWFWTSITTLGGWLIYWIAIFLLAASLDLPLSYWQTTAFFSLTSVAGYLPISIAGIGTREAIMVGLFGQIGLSLEQALAFSLVIFSLNIVIVVEGSVGLLTRPLPLRRLRQGESD